MSLRECTATRVLDKPQKVQLATKVLWKVRVRFSCGAEQERETLLIFRTQRAAAAIQQGYRWMG